MKKLKILLLGILFLISISINAISLKVDLSCPTSANESSEISCKVEIHMVKILIALIHHQQI
ncbi:MAG: hypothetical protein PUD59_03380 [bacterium]|nr:hypothetical protein [bacterium]